ncbi:hypothetical protein NQ318_000455, partial [Aromia moschata]
MNSVDFLLTNKDITYEIRYGMMGGNQSAWTQEGLNKDKTQQLSFSTRNASDNDEQVKLLGIVLDGSLNWSKHIEELAIHKSQHMLARGSDNHDYNTRSANMLKMPKYRLTKSINNSLNYKLYNKLPDIETFKEMFLFNFGGLEKRFTRSSEIRSGKSREKVRRALGSVAPSHATIGFGLKPDQSALQRKLALNPKLSARFSASLTQASWCSELRAAFTAPI